MRFHVVVILAVFLGLAACSGPVGPNGPAVPPPTDDPSHPDYETFDPAGYNAEPSPGSEPIEHDVPDRLMEGRVDVPNEVRQTVRTVEGFRIQIYSGEDRNVAEGILTEARVWWETQRGAAEIQTDFQPEVAYVQPYYRVRIGAFEFRQDAEATLTRVRQRYADAFLVPDLVTIRD